MLCTVTNIAQRHANPELQPVTTDKLYPTHKHLLIKRSVRCKVGHLFFSYVMPMRREFLFCGSVRLNPVYSTESTFGKKRSGFFGGSG